LKVVHEKTGSLIGAAGKFGAMFSGADQEQIDRLCRLGSIVGTAFQIADDIIDIESESDESGKLPGTDLREGVHTLPMLYALRETAPEGARLRELLGGPIHDDAEVHEALTLLRASSGMAKAKKTLVQYADQAHHELDLLPESLGRGALQALVDYTVSRHG
jgi:heptaprenyl diphosphate synthase